MRVRWLRKALVDLEAELAFIAQDDPKVATDVAGRIFAALEQLGSHPALGRPGRLPGTRELVVPATRFLIPYRVQENEVQVLRVFHTSRKPPSRW
jgi:plasmid stabilization system protein ParE